nr:hypothetical protein [Tanacetum cinerariifolium]
MVRSMFTLTTLPLSFWDHALEFAVRILNMVTTKKVDKTPYEIWHGKAPNLYYLKVWGCEAYVKRDSADKLHQRFIKCIFVGYPKKTMGYYFYFPPENKVIVASEIPVESESLGSPPKLIPVRRSERTTRAPNRLCLNIEVEDDEVGDLGEPANYKAAMLDPDKVVRSKWLYKKKTNMDGKVHTYKAHLVAKGCTQTYGIDYEETFSPVADIRAIRILIAIAADFDYEIWQIDVKTAFLNGRLDEDIYMEQPEGLKEVKDYLGKCFSMKDLGEAAYILGIKIYRDRSRWLIGHSQSAYIDKILKKYNMYNSKKGARHFLRRYHYVREQVKTGEIKLIKVHTDDNLADPFTKALPRGMVIDHATAIELQFASSFMHTCD